MKSLFLSQCDEELQKLITQAKGASQNSYSPYSNFKVGCAILLSNKQVYTGCNVENASYGLANCAERTAIFKAQSENRGKITIEKLVVYTPTQTPTMPCGACRQVIYEFGTLTKIYSACDNDSQISYIEMKDLLPYAFGPDDLRIF